VIAVASLLVVLLLDVLITRIASVALRATGLSPESGRRTPGQPEEVHGMPLIPVPDWRFS
jgi:hypothetical protein